MFKNHNAILLLGLFIISIYGCGGGGDSSSPVGPQTTPTSSVVTVTFQSTLQIPVGSPLQQSQLTASSNIATGSLQGLDGSYSIPTKIDTSKLGISLTIIENANLNPIFLKIVRKDSYRYNYSTGATSTADALVLYDPCFLQMSPALFSKAEEKVLLHPSFSELIKEIEKALIAFPDNPLDSANQPGIYQLAGTIANDILKELASSPTKSIRSSMDPVGYVGVEDDPTGNQPTVFLANYSFLHWKVLIKKDSIVFPSRASTGMFPDHWFLERRTVLSSLYDWVDRWANKAECSIGPGSLTFDFTPLKELSVLDGLCGIFSSCVGLGNLKIEKVDSLLGAMVGFAGDGIGVIQQLASMDGTDEIDIAKNVAKFIGGAGKAGFTLLYETYFEAVKEQLRKGWYHSIMKFFASKLYVGASAAGSLADLARVVYACKKASNSYYESGKQSESGKYPADETTPTPTPAPTTSSTEIKTGTKTISVGYGANVAGDFQSVQLSINVIDYDQKLLGCFKVSSDGSNLDDSGEITLGNYSYYRSSVSGYRPVRFAGSAANLDSFIKADTQGDSYSHDAREAKGNKTPVIGDCFYFNLASMYGVFRITDVTSSKVSIEYKYNSAGSTNLK